MVDTIRITETNSPPATADVCHYDELDEFTKEQFPGLIEDEYPIDDPAIVAALTGHEYVKFTAYYRVRREPGACGYACQD